MKILLESTRNSVLCGGAGFLKLYADRLKRYNITYDEHKRAFLETDNFDDVINIARILNCKFSVFSNQDPINIDNSYISIDYEDGDEDTLEDVVIDAFKNFRSN